MLQVASTTIGLELIDCRKINVNVKIGKVVALV